MGSQSLTRQRQRVDAVVLVALMAYGTSVQAGIHDCRPDVKYECSGPACERITEDFRHAEYFIFSESDNTLAACLWTACYEGVSVKYVHADGFTAVGRLKKDGSQDETRLVSLSISNDKRFTAIWNHSGDSTTLDMGTCKTAD
jgi:hypothetical protein